MAVFGTIVSIVFVTLPIVFGSENPEFIAILAGPFLLVVFLELCFMFGTWECILKNLHPIGLQTALQQPSWRWGFRHFAATWWICRFLLGLSLVIALMLENPNLSEGRAQRFLFSVLLEFAWIHLTYSSLVLAAGCYSRRERLEWLWSKRLFFEVVLVLGANLVKLSAFGSS